MNHQPLIRATQYASLLGVLVLFNTPLFANDNAQENSPESKKARYIENLEHETRSALILCDYLWKQMDGNRAKDYREGSQAACEDLLNTLRTFGILSDEHEQEVRDDYKKSHMIPSELRVITSQVARYFPTLSDEEMKEVEAKKSIVNILNKLVGIENWAEGTLIPEYCEDHERYELLSQALKERESWEDFLRWMKLGQYVRPVNQTLLDALKHFKTLVRK